MRDRILYMWPWKVGAVIVALFLISLYILLTDFIFSTNAACNIGIEWKRHFTEGAHGNVSGNVKITNLWNMKIPMEDMEIHNETLIVTDRNCNEVVSFHLRSGQTIWAQEFAGPDELELNMDREQVYATGVWSWKRELIALDINTGQKKWLNNSQNNKRIGLDVVTLSDGRVLVDMGEGPRLVDPDTGKFSDVIAPPFGREPLSDGYFYWRWDGSRVYAVDRIDHQTVWSSAQIEVPKGDLVDISYHSGIVVANFAILNDNFPWLSPLKLIGLNYDDGALLWEVADLPPEFKFLADGERIYIFDGTKLLLLNALNGDEIGRIAFTPEEYVDWSEFRNNFFRVQGNIIALYFADTDTLSVYEIEN